MADDDIGVNSGDVPFSEGKMPSTEEILAALDNTPGLDEAMKLELRKSILGEGEEGLKKLLNPDAMKVDAVDNSRQFIILLILVSLVIMVLVFFGYKLYTSLVERERRREEKKRQKQQKKKK